MAHRVHMLRGGYLNDGRIIKQGNYVVRRQGHPWPEAVNEALEVLARRGFSHSPRLVGRIDECSVTLTYLPGKALGSPVPQWAASRNTLIHATHFMAEFAMAAADIRPSITTSDWLTRPSSHGDDLVHGDPHPTNMIFNRFRRPTGLIDFELATLGPGIWNLMSLIFTWAPLEPANVTCWRNAPVSSPEKRIQTILRHWHTRVSRQELLTVCHEFVCWRKNWIQTLADLGNQGAMQFIADPEFNGRLHHAVRIMASVTTSVLAGRAIGLQPLGALGRK